VTTNTDLLNSAEKHRTVSHTQTETVQKVQGEQAAAH